MTAVKIVIIAALAVLAVSFGCYFFAFGVNRKYTQNPNREFTGAFKAWDAQIHEMISKAMEEPFEWVETESFDGLILKGRLYERFENAPLMIMFHGYKSCSLLDFCGGLYMGFDNGCNVLLVDQRAHGESGGKYLSFGIKERYDVLSWTDFAAQRYGKERPVILIGMSMGAATVLMSADRGLPMSVKGIVADCGYTTPRAIMEKVCRDYKLPVGLMMFFVSLGARIFGGFGLEDASAPEALKKCGIPVLFIHGDSDTFVPCFMGQENYNACASEKRIYIAPGADHAVSFMVDRKRYEKELKDFTADALTTSR